MQVVDHAPHAWFLLREGGALLLDVNCSHGPVDYAWTMVLNDEEVAQFHALGRDSITPLAERVQWTAPGVLGNRSPYRGRKVDAETRQRVIKAIQDWMHHGRHSTPEM